MPRLKKPAASTPAPATKKVYKYSFSITDSNFKPSANPLSREFLADLRKNIYANNTLVANGNFSKSKRSEPYKFIIAVQVHSR